MPLPLATLLPAALGIAKQVKQAGGLKGIFGKPKNANIRTTKNLNSRPQNFTSNSKQFKNRVPTKGKLIIKAAQGSSEAKELLDKHYGHGTGNAAANLRFGDSSFENVGLSKEQIAELSGGKEIIKNRNNTMKEKIQNAWEKIPTWAKIGGPVLAGGAILFFVFRKRKNKSW